MIKNHLILSMERFLIWWVSIRSRSSVAPQVCKVCRQSHPNKYRPANVAKESKMPCAGKDWKWFVRYRYGTMGLWSTSQFWECNHQRSSLLTNKNYAGKEVTSIQISWILDHNDFQNIQNNEALILYTKRMSVCVSWFKSYLPHSGVWSESLGRPPNHQNHISYILKPRNCRADVIWKESCNRNLGWFRPPWQGFPPKLLFPKTWMIFQGTCL